MIEYSGIDIKKEVGKPGKAVAKFKGDYEGVEATLTLKAEYQDEIEEVIPLSSRELELKIIDPNRKLDEFHKKDPAIYDDFVLGTPMEETFVAGGCSVCGAEMWISPKEVESICAACQKEIASEIFKKEEKERLKQKRIKSASKGPEVLRLPDETIEDLQKMEDERFREERRQRAGVQA